MIEVSHESKYDLTGAFSIRSCIGGFLVFSHLKLIYLTWSLDLLDLLYKPLGETSVALLMLHGMARASMSLRLWMVKKELCRSSLIFQLGRKFHRRIYRNQMGMPGLELKRKWKSLEIKARWLTQSGLFRHLVTARGLFLATVYVPFVITDYTSIISFYNHFSPQSF